MVSERDKVRKIGKPQPPRKNSERFRRKIKKLNSRIELRNSNFPGVFWGWSTQPFDKVSGCEQWLFTTCPSCPIYVKYSTYRKLVYKPSHEKLVFFCSSWAKDQRQNCLVSLEVYMFVVPTYLGSITQEYLAMTNNLEKRICIPWVKRKSWETDGLSWRFE